MSVLNLRARERDTIIAALRLYQQNARQMPQEILDIAENNRVDLNASLSVEEIDALIENKVNVEDHAPEFVHVGTVDVDAGSIWIGDPCYVLKDEGEARPKDLGANWHDICDRFFERSGYRARSDAWRDWSCKRDNAGLHSPEAMEMYEKLNTETKDLPTAEREAHFKPWHDLMDKLRKEWEEKNPFHTDLVDTGVANFTHDGGHGGMGIMMSTNFGDGSYPVYVKYEGGRPSLVLIDFYGEPAEDEAEDEAEEVREEAA